MGISTSKSSRYAGERTTAPRDSTQTSLGALRPRRGPLCKQRRGRLVRCGPARVRERLGAPARAGASRARGPCSDVLRGGTPHVAVHSSSMTRTPWRSASSCMRASIEQWRARLSWMLGCDWSVACGKTSFRALAVGVAVSALGLAGCGGQSTRDDARGSGGFNSGSGTGGNTSGAGGAKKDTGLERRDGLLHRVRAVTCENAPSRGFNASELANKTCAVDADCAYLKYGFCDVVPGPGGSTQCLSGCMQDADCAAGEICECLYEIGRCVAASCSTDADCNGGFCGLVEDRGLCDDGSTPSMQFLCTTVADSCRISQDCASFRCGVENGARACLETVSCAPMP